MTSTISHDNLSSAEALIADAFFQGSVVDLPLPDSERTVRSGFIEKLLLLKEYPSGSRPALHIVGARIAGRLDLEGAAISVPIRLEQCLFEEAPNLRDAQAVTIRLPGCQLPGLDAAGLQTRGNLELNAGFICCGKADLLGVSIGGMLRLSQALLFNPGEVAIMLSRATVNGALLGGGLTAEGQVRMISAKIGGLFSLRGGQLRNPGGIALEGERIEVGESIFLDSGFRSEGRVLLQNSKVGGGFDGKNSLFCAADLTCLNLVRVTVGRNIGLRSSGFLGKVTLNGASVGGDVVLTGADFKGEDSELILDHVQANAVRLRYSKPPVLISMRHASADLIEDDPQTWPEKLALAGLTYGTLEPAAETTAGERAGWLARDVDGYRPQPYEQLVAAYKANGEERNAKQVALRNERKRRATLGLPGKILGFSLDYTVGYGYRTWLAGIWLVGFVIAGTTIFSIWPPEPVSPYQVVGFQPFIYTLDLMLPVVNLGQQDNWVAEGPVRWFAWLLILAGWALTTAVIAGVTRLLNRS